jgi:hypothetical protein
MIDRSTAIGLLYGSITLGLAVWKRYRSWWWYDNLAHFAAGISLAGLVTGEDSTTTEDALLVGGLTAAWEIVEFAHNTYPWDGSLPDRVAAEDTMLDSLLVALGAWLVINGGESE